jgi:hypothetical protein
MASTGPASTALITATMLDSAGRFIANVGVPAAITFFLLSQITPRLDSIATLQAAANTNLAIIGASCGRVPSVANLSPGALERIARRDD